VNINAFDKHFRVDVKGRTLQIVKRIENSLKLYYDNKSTVLYSNNNRSSASKHINIKFISLKKKVQSGWIFIEHKGSHSMIAYPLTSLLMSFMKILL